MIKVLFFAQLAEFAGTNSIELEAAPATTARTLIEAQVGVLPAALTDALLHDAVMVSINKKMATWDDELSNNDELAFLPPFSGG